MTQDEQNLLRWILAFIQILIILFLHRRIFSQASGVLVQCECCQDDMPYDHEHTPSMTAYNWDGIGEDPNRDIRLCPECSGGHVEEMEYRWAEYYGGLL